MASNAKARYWILTIPHEHFMPYCPPGVKYIRGQLEHGGSGFLHWQLVVHTEGQQRLAWIRKTFGPYHAEVCRSEAAEAYVWKEETSVTGTRFELGARSLKRNAPADWDKVYELAARGDFEDIPSDIKVRCYTNLKHIAKDNMRPEAMERTVHVFWGPTHTGKSHRAWSEAGFTAYPKPPTTVYWDGYKGHENVVIEEFRGEIGISHLLRWFDKYPVQVEAKHGATILCARRIWITSNISPDEWYPNVDTATRAALLRRLRVTNLTEVYVLE
jgi:hypothetical protein